MPLYRQTSPGSSKLDYLFKHNDLFGKKYIDKKTSSATSRSSTSTSSSTFSISSDSHDEAKKKNVRWTPEGRKTLPKNLPTPVKSEELRLDAGGPNVCERLKKKRMICKQKKGCASPSPGCKASMVFIPPLFTLDGIPARCHFKKTDKTKQTQTLYREASVQTLPYLPPVCNVEEAINEDFELFKLPTILPGVGPPGLYEVEILERARKRWAFAKALRTKLKHQMKEVRETMKKSEHRMILEAFEWEHWIEREEYIQELQMLRLEIVIRMFNQREQEMRAKSKASLEVRCSQITARRDTLLQKNQIEYDRAMRRLEMAHDEKPRKWVKQDIITELGHPASEFYGPQMRYGVSPSHAHYDLKRKEFEQRIELLDTKVASLKTLECPFEKLNRWAQPKQRLKELEKNFCSEKNLMKLYNTLKGLRQQSHVQKGVPRCLIEKPPLESKRSETTASWHGTTSYDDVEEEGSDKEGQGDIQPEMYCKDRRQKRRVYLQERRGQEMEFLLAKYEGSCIGWLMRFLANEEKNLIIQRRAQYISAVAQNERCRREALANILERKENQLRQRMEYIYDNTIGTQEAVRDEFFKEVMDMDIKIKADCEAQMAVTELAKQVDEDIQRWLVQAPCEEGAFTNTSLATLLRELIFPCSKEILRKKENEYMGSSIVEELLSDIFDALEAFDIANYTANEVVDRGIDNDLEYFTSECSCCSDSDVSICDSARREVMAVLRKVIRRAVPGRRWKTSTERLVNTNIEDLIDEAFDEAIQRPPKKIKHRLPPKVESHPSFDDLQKPVRMALGQSSSGTSTSRVERIQHYNKVSVCPNITKELKKVEPKPERPSDTKSTDLAIVLHTTQYRQPSQPTGEGGNLHDVGADTNILERECFTDIHIHQSKGEDSSYSSAVVTTICFDYASDSDESKKVAPKPEPPEEVCPTECEKEKPPHTVGFQSDDQPNLTEIVEALLDCIFETIRGNTGACKDFDEPTDLSEAKSSSEGKSDSDHAVTGTSTDVSFSGYEDDEDDVGDGAAAEEIPNFPLLTKSEPIELPEDHSYIKLADIETSSSYDIEGMLPLDLFAAQPDDGDTTTSPAAVDSNSSSNSLKIQWICPRYREQQQD